MTERTKQATNQSGLARAEVAGEVDHKSRMQCRCQRCPGGSSRFLVGQVRRKSGVAIIPGMSNLDHVHSSSASSPGDHKAVPDIDQIRQWANTLGFNSVSVSGVDLETAEPGLISWLERGFHGEMDYMARHGLKRARPAELVPGTVRVITARMNYWPNASEAGNVLADGSLAYVSRYALGRDYHKLLRARLQKLADAITAVAPHAYRVFVDSAPVLEVELAARSGLGWRGKHTLLLDREAGSYFFLGEIFTDMPLEEAPPVPAHCGSCRACLDACPTGAIVAPYRVDARRCISYLTIELKGAIPEEFRTPIGNRIYGCDDCQLACPWNRFAQLTVETDFAVRHGLDAASLVELFAWTETDFRERTAGSAIHRIGFERWSRNIAVALGNAPHSEAVMKALSARREDPSALVREHVEWAIAQQGRRAVESGAGGDRS